MRVNRLRPIAFWLVGIAGAFCLAVAAAATAKQKVEQRVEQRAEQVASADSGEVLSGRAVTLTAPGSRWDLDWQKARARIAGSGVVELTYFSRETLRAGVSGEKQLLHDLQRGRIQLGQFSAQGLAAVIPEFHVAMAPRLFNSPGEAEFIFENYLFAAVSELLQRKGLRLLQWGRLEPLADLTPAELSHGAFAYGAGAVLVNQLWYEGATPVQVDALRDAWHGVLRESLTALEPRVDEQQLGPGAGQKVGPETGPEVLAPAVEQLLERVGGGSRSIYAAILRGKSAFAATLLPKVPTKVGKEN